MEEKTFNSLPTIALLPSSSLSPPPLVQSECFQVGKYLLVQDLYKEWLKVIIKQNDGKGRIFISYVGFDIEYDEWINVETQRDRYQIIDGLRNISVFDNNFVIPGKVIEIFIYSREWVLARIIKIVKSAEITFLQVQPLRNKIISFVNMDDIFKMWRPFVQNKDNLKIYKCILMEEQNRILTNLNTTWRDIFEYNMGHSRFKEFQEQENNEL